MLYVGTMCSVKVLSFFQFLIVDRCVMLLLRLLCHAEMLVEVVKTCCDRLKMLHAHMTWRKEIFLLVIFSSWIEASRLAA